MDKVLPGPVRITHVPASRFTLGRAAGSLAACLWLWTSAGALFAAAPAASLSAYQSALDRFNHADYTRALTLLDHAPAATGASGQADISNLRGAILLRQHHYDQAQAEFARAARLDPNLWAALFNEAEVSFRQKRYAESRRQFAALLDQTNRLFHSEQHHFVLYKMLLAGLCAGDEKPALAFIADYRDDARPPLAWYYLNAALARRHDHAAQADQWLAQADTKFVPGSGQSYADSFDRLGWGTGRAGAVETPATWPDAHGVAIAENTVAKSSISHPLPAAGQSIDSRTPPPTLAVVEVSPPSAEVAFHELSPDRTTEPDDHPGTLTAPPLAASSEASSPADLPPVAGEMVTMAEATDRTGPIAVVSPATLARSHRSHATPSPSPDASASPDASPGVTANQGGATPAASPSAEFTEKYEAAYVKFLEKNYPETLSLLDEADKIQSGQPQSIGLRFKAHYALAYIEYRKQNYPGALAELDNADQTQKNADSYNLRGLIFSKQHNYDQAEAMFHKAIVTDPGLWAAKFNYAELPFNRGNYTDARSRFEELFSQTDAAKQPREAELTQYKVFLTLLLEGKVEAASTFMDHLNFSGATPARYFCNAALNFRAGSVDKAKNWIDDAKKEFPPQLVAIFIESFYRLGWMADPNAPPGTAVALATPAGTPSVVTSGTQPTTVATATAAPAATAAASSTPIIVAAASAMPSPLAPATATPRPAAATTPAMGSATPTASPARSVAVASGSPASAASASPVIAATTPAVTPAHSIPAVAVTPRPMASAPPVVAAAVPGATPARTVASATATPNSVGTPATARATPALSHAKPPEVAAAGTAAEQARRKSHRRIIVLFFLLIYVVYCANRMRSVLTKRKQHRLRASARRRAVAESSK